MICLGKSAAMEDLATTDLSLSQIRALFAIAEADTPLPVHEIATAIGLSVAATGRTVDRMLRLGLVDRREDPADRRIKRVSLTADGHTMVDNQLTVHHGILRAFVATLPEEHRRSLTQALRPIVDDGVDYFGLAAATLSHSTDRTEPGLPEFIPSTTDQKVTS